MWQTSQWLLLGGQKMRSNIVVILLLFLGFFGLLWEVALIHKGISELQQIVYNQEAQINEYEFLLADMWAEKEHCRKRLGAFYKPIRKE